MHYNIYITDAPNLLLHVCILANLPEDSPHGVPKHVGKNVLRRCVCIPVHVNLIV
jgi:hypothetical protein